MKLIISLVTALVLGFSIPVQAQSFSVDREANAFLNRVAATEESGFHDARSRHVLRRLVDANFTSFVLAVRTRTPIFSAGGNVSVSGNISFEDRVMASKLLLPKLRSRDTEHNPALRLLKGMVEQNAEMTPEQMRGLRNLFNDMQRKD